MTRRLALLAALCVAVTLPAAPVGSVAKGDCLGMVSGLDLDGTTVVGLQQAMAAGKLTSVDLVDAYERRIAAYDVGAEHLNSVRELHPTRRAQAALRDAERARGIVRGPLHGIPVLLKDNVGTVDQHTTAGSIALEGSFPLHDSGVVDRLRAGGAVILGKANLSEFANWVQLGMPNGYSSLGGQVVNAYTGGDPSGSSSGSGVAASMSFAAVTIGSETSGSILSPSTANSLVGVKPTVGLVSRYGIIPLAPSFDTAGPMTRNVTDAAALLGVVAGTDPRDAATADADSHLPAGRDYVAGLTRDALTETRIGYNEGDTSDALFADALAALEAGGATLVPIETLSSTSAVGITEIAAIPNEFKYSLNRYLAEETVDTLRVRTLSDIVAYNEQHPDKVKYGQNLLQISDATPGSGPLATAQTTPTILASRAAIDIAFAEGDLDAIVAPGASNANIGAAAGYPSVAVPAGYEESGAPFGITFLGAAWSEQRLLAFAYAYEQATHLRVPPGDLAPDVLAGGCTAARPVTAPAPQPGSGQPLAATGGLPLASLATLAVAAALYNRRDERFSRS